MKQILAKKIQTKQGFSLVEFIVVLVIFSIMSSVSLFNYNAYTKKISQTNVAQDIALSIRQAQVYGLSASEGILGGENFTPEDYLSSHQSIEDITDDRSIRGVSINIADNSLIIFQDTNNSFTYNDDGPFPDRIIDVRAIRSQDVDIVNIELCDSGAVCDAKESGQVDIVFQRPYPDAFISLDKNSSTNYSFANIFIGEEGDESSGKYIEISAIGNISVHNK